MIAFLSLQSLAKGAPIEVHSYKKQSIAFPGPPLVKHISQASFIFVFKAVSIWGFQ